MYAILLTTPPYKDPQQDKKFCLILNTLLISYWVGSTLIGALFAKEFIALQGLEFTLIAFLVVLVLEQYLKYKQNSIIIISLIAFALGYWWFPNNMLLPAILICCLVLGISFYWGEYRA